MLSIARFTVIAGLVWAGAGLTAESAVGGVSHGSPAAVISAEEQVEPPTPEERAALRAFFQDKKVEIAAGVVGLSVEEYEAALADGESFKTLTTAAGLTGEELRQKLKDGLVEVLDEAVAEGLMTAEQAQFVQDHPQRFFGRWWWARQLRRPAVQAQLAESLGISLEELEASREAGQTLPELVDELGLDREEVFRELQNRFALGVLKGIEDGRLTAEQGARLLLRGRWLQRPAPGGE